MNVKGPIEPQALTESAACFEELPGSECDLRLYAAGPMLLCHRHLGALVRSAWEAMYGENLDAQLICRSLKPGEVVGDRLVERLRTLAPEEEADA